MIVGQTMEMALGLPVVIEGFNDKKARTCHPFTLEKLTMANMYLSSFDNSNFYENFKSEDATLCMLYFFKEAFRPTTEEETDELLHAIDNENFEEIVCDIKKVSGISDNNGEVDIYKTTESIDWKTSVNIIPIYTSTPHEKVKDLTLTQFQTTLQLIGKKINFEYKTSTVGLVKEPSDYIEESDHPLYSEPEIDGKKYITMDDVQGLFDM